MSDIILYQQLFELDELLVEILRHLLDDKKSINQLLLTAKWLSKRLHSTTLWTSVGVSFYDYHENIITPRMLWHLLRERQIELDLQKLKQLTTYQEDTNALKYLIHLSRSDREAHLMLSNEFIESPLQDIILLHDKPEHQELVCVLLSKLFKRLEVKSDSIINHFVPLLVKIIINNEEQLASSFGIAACKALSELLTYKNVNIENCMDLCPLCPIIGKLMTHDNRNLQKSGFSLASTVFRGTFGRELVNQREFWPSIVSGLSNKSKSVRKYIAIILSNLVEESGIHRAQINSEEIFPKLLALRSDSLETTFVVLSVLRNIGEYNIRTMNETQKRMWHDHFDDLLDFCEKRLQASLKAINNGDKVKNDYKAITPTVAFLCGLMDVAKALPNKENLRQKVLQSSVLQLVRTLDVPNYLRKKIDAL